MGAESGMCRGGRAANRAPGPAESTGMKILPEGRCAGVARVADPLHAIFMRRRGKIFIF